jgi:glycosidase
MRFTSNHDECAWDDTPLGLFGGKNASISAFVISAFMGGVPLIYNGQEVGCPVKLPFFSRSPIDWTTNPDMFRTYKTLMAIRAAHPALRTGDLTSFSNNDIAAFQRKTTTDEVLVIVNTRSTAKTFNIPASFQNTTWSDAGNSAGVTLGSSLELSAYQFRIFVK